ncbi:hypothetical protein LCGC14_0460810 [marine sediment metagenome]|uniref:Uncharacterized protein n=1 Tax=marine sediment metagenome TaxID=412755 RepID=A0A0F9SK74_9ZZZZ|nr:hypothetical protein [bacterium]
MSKCPKCKKRVRQKNRKKIHGSTWIHKKCPDPGEPKDWLEYQKTVDPETLFKSQYELNLPDPEEEVKFSEEGKNEN